MSETENRVVLITGVAGGIGSATAKLFHEAGWIVVGVDRKPNSHIDYIPHHLQADASKPDDIWKALEYVKSEIGRLDALVNNAAIQFSKPMMEMTLDEWDQIMNVNVRAAFIFSQAAFEMLRQSQGSIVNVSSVHAVATSADIAGYAASKGALLALTRALAIELSEHTIRVNAILPGAVDTQMLRDGLNRNHVQGGTIDTRMQQLADKTVMKRIGTPEEIARSIMFLADNKQSAFMTGQPLIIDGGATARLSTE